MVASSSSEQIEEIISDKKNEKGLDSTNGQSSRIIRCNPRSNEGEKKERLVCKAHSETHVGKMIKQIKEEYETPPNVNNTRKTNSVVSIVKPTAENQGSHTPEQGWSEGDVEKMAVDIPANLLHSRDNYEISIAHAALNKAQKSHGIKDKLTEIMRQQHKSEHCSFRNSNVSFFVFFEIKKTENDTSPRIEITLSVPTEKDLETCCLGTKHVETPYSKALESVINDFQEVARHYEISTNNKNKYLSFFEEFKTCNPKHEYYESHPRKRFVLLNTSFDKNIDEAFQEMQKRKRLELTQTFLERINLIELIPKKEYNWPDVVHNYMFSVEFFLGELKRKIIETYTLERSQDQE